MLPIGKHSPRFLEFKFCISGLILQKEAGNLSLPASFQCQLLYFGLFHHNIDDLLRHINFFYNIPRQLIRHRVFAGCNRFFLADLC